MRIKDEIKLSSYGDFLQHVHDPDISRIHDYTADNGKCRDCGNCCGNMIPLTLDDYKRIKAYIIKRHIAPARPRIQPGPFAKPTVHNFCPFLLNTDGHRCAIYPVRPGICKNWTCHDPANNQALIKWYFSVFPDIRTVDMYMTFFPEQTIKEMNQIQIKEAT